MINVRKMAVTLKHKLQLRTILPNDRLEILATRAACSVQCTISHVQRDVGCSYLRRALCDLSQYGHHGVVSVHTHLCLCGWYDFQSVHPALELIIVHALFPLMRTMASRMPPLSDVV